MGERIKKGLALMLLEFASLGNAYANEHNYSKLSPPYYQSTANEPNQMNPTNHRREDGGFSAIYLGITGLIAVYFLRKKLR
jgi:hypothetical protein